MNIHTQATNNNANTCSLTYDGNLTQFYKDVSYLHRKTMPIITSILETFPKGIRAELQTSDELSNDIRHLDIFIVVRQKEYDAIWKVLMWGLNLTKSRKIGLAGLTREFDFTGIATYSSGKIRYDYELKIYADTPYAEKLIEQFNTVDILRNSIVSLPYEELIHHKAACEKRIGSMTSNVEEHSSTEFLLANVLASRELPNTVGVN